MKNFNLRQMLAAIAAALILTVSCSKDEDITLDFDITVPENWTEVIRANEGLVYTAERNAVNAVDTVREYMLVFKDPLSGYTLDTYYAALKANILLSDFYEYTLYETDTTINGADSKKLICQETGYYISATMDTSIIDLVTTRYVFFENSAGYTVGMVAIDTTYYRVKPVFDDIIASFRFK